DVPFIRFMELKTLDLRMVSRGQLPTTGAVVIATVDEKSLSEIGRWPWSRSVIATLIDKLKQDGAKTIAFDIVFSEPDENASLKTIQELAAELGRRGIDEPRITQLLKTKRAAADTDAILAKSIAAAQNVTAGYFFYTTAREVGHMSKEDIARSREAISCSRYPMVMAKTTPDEHAFIHAYAAVPNLKEISEAAANCGYFNAFPDSDGVIRWAPLVVKFGDSFYYSLAIAALIQFADMPMSGVRLADFGVESVMIGDIAIPVDESGRMLI
ncbi:MAG: CHASE2 domain-containing protein, partial [Syntrophales bacterium]|nr:CHASE2 domain-containing protein [Syntrophales bacterium]